MRCSEMREMGVDYGYKNDGSMLENLDLCMVSIHCITAAFDQYDLVCHVYRASLDVCATRENAVFDRTWHCST